MREKWKYKGKHLRDKEDRKGLMAGRGSGRSAAQSSRSANSGRKSLKGKLTHSALSDGRFAQLPMTAYTKYYFPQ